MKKEVIVAGLSMFLIPMALISNHYELLPDLTLGMVLGVGIGGLLVSILMRKKGARSKP